MGNDLEGSERLRKAARKNAGQRQERAKSAAGKKAARNKDKTSAGGTIERELLRRFRSSLSTRTFGFRLTEIRRGYVVLEMNVTPRFLQAHGRLHGGVVATLADTAAAFAAYTAAPPRSRLVTLEMKINFLEGVDRGVVRAEGRLIRLGRNVGVSESDVRDGAGRLVAKALVTVAVAGPRETLR